MFSKKWVFLLGLCITDLSLVFSDTAFMTGYTTSSTIYMFDTANPSIVTPIITSGIITPDGITVSPDGQTVYVTDHNSTSSDVYTFPVNGPYILTALGTGIENPIGIAISSDGSTCYVALDGYMGGTAGIYSFPTGVINPTVTTLTITGTSIAGPAFIVISGTTAYVGDYASGFIYSGAITPSSYDATLIQTAPVSGLAVHGAGSNGNLYWPNVGRQVHTVSLASPLSTPELIASTSQSPQPSLDGLATTTDGKTCFVTCYSGPHSGLYSFPTDQGSSQTLQLVSTTQAIAIAIVATSSPVNPPTNGTGKQVFNRFANYGEYFNKLQWVLSTSTDVASYRVYRAGQLIATLGSASTTYEDHNQKKGSITYAVTAVDTSGNESSPLTIQL